MSRPSLVLATATALALAAPALAHADEPAAVRANTVSLDPLLGTLGFTGRNVGEWALSYERRLGPQHAVLVEQATVHVHMDPWHLTTFGVGAGYRYYLRPAASAPFVGILGGGKLGTGRFGTGEGNKLTARGAFVTAHAGYRRTWPSGFTLAARIGAGWASYSINDDAPMGAAEVKDDRLAPLPVEIDSELSLGYAF